MKKSPFKIAFLTIMLFASTMVFAQPENIFWDRSFWKTAPSIEVVKAKIAEGNDAVARNGRGFDAVSNAIFANAPLATIEFLLSLEGNSPNKVTHDGRNYIFWAASRENIPVMKILVEKGSRMDIVDSHGLNPTNFAAVNGVINPAVYDLLIASGADVKSLDHHKANAILLIAARDKDFVMTQYFIDKGLDLKATDEDGNSAFNYAARNGNIAMMDLLIAKGVNYNGLNKKGGNAMLFAAKGGRNMSSDLSVYNYLESKGVAANVTTKDGETPLQLLANNSKDLDVLNYFVSKGVDVNQADKDGNNALMNAASRNSLAIVTFLAEKTKDVNAINKDGETALNRAVAGNNIEVVNYLISKGAKPNSATAEALISSFNPKEKEPFNAKLEALKKDGLNFAQAQENGNTILHYAVENNNLLLVKMALKEGVKVNAKNNEGNTALLIAAMKATNADILQFLIDNGANKNAKTDFDETAYDLASENELLEKNNIDINFLKS